MNRQRGIPCDVTEAPAVEEADNAVALLKSFLHVQRGPACRQALLVFRHAQVVVVDWISEAAEVGFSRLPGSSQVLGDQRPASADGGIGLVERTQSADTRVHADLFDHRAVHHNHAAKRRSGTDHRCDAFGSHGQNSREILGLQSSHDCIHRYHFHRVIPGFMWRRRAHLSDPLVRLAARRLQHLGNFLLGRENNGIAVGEVLIMEILHQPVGRVRWQKSRPGISF